MTRKRPDENAKNKDWKTPMDLVGTSAEQYPERGKANPVSKTRKNPRRNRQSG